MTAVFRYISYDGSTFSVDLGTFAIRLGKVPGFTELALLGAVGSSSVVVEDTTGTAGHASDGFLPLQIFAVDENSASTQRLFAGWTGLITDTAGPEGPTDSLRTGVQNRIEISLEDANTLAGRRALKPKASDSSVSRPAESAATRISWLLGTAYFSGVADNGLVHPAGSPTLTANDYSSSHPADVLNDVCTATGDNWFVYWDRTAAAWSLAVFNFTTYSGYTASMGLSNVVGLYDSSTAGAGVSNVWLIEPGAQLTKDPASLATEVQYTYAKGVVDIVGSSSTYPVVTQIASSTTVKTSALATTKANRYLTDNAAPQHRISCTSKVLAAHVNDALAGQLIIASFRQWPQYVTPSYFRISGLTKAQVEESDQFYTVNFQLIPAAPVSPTSTSAVVYRGFVDYTGQIDSPGTGDYEMGYSGTGDAPPGSSDYPSQPKTGLVAYLLSGGVPIGFTVSGGGTLAVASAVKCGLGYNGTGMTVEHTVLVNGVVQLTSGVYTDPSGGGPHEIAPTLTIAGNITVSAGDTVTSHYIIGGHRAEIGSVPIAGIFAPPYQFSVSGTLS